jgi:hypothetical protein
MNEKWELIKKIIKNVIAYSFLVFLLGSFTIAIGYEVIDFFVSDTSDQSIENIDYNGDLDCSDFSSQRAAQRVLDKYSTDVHDLDRDDDGIACEWN